ncbi:hypothetical protein QYE76_022344 [Lolium multiflorum]|uniref:Uncharacterized protein n=1 Tax=Lolium multiflorum TaxID=4521 RepID=A0AAD8RAT8_LOLMU|nr:hypothetical protein QYE76_022344 [Lolium multiflorum]
MEKNEMPIVGASAAAPVQAPVAASNVAAGASAAAPVQAPVAASNVAAGASAAAPVQAPVAASNVAAGASAAAPVQAPVHWDPYEPVQYDAPKNPYDTTIVDYESEVESSDVDSDDESFHTKTRHVLRRLQAGQYGRPFAQGIYKCPFCNRRLFDTNFNTLLNHAESIGRHGARVGSTVNVHAYMAKHKALGIHLRNLQASHTRHLEALNVPTALSMEHYAQTESYELGNGGSLVFERDLYLVSEKLERPPPQFHGVRIHNTPEGEQQWMITADLKGSPEPPISERILFSFKACNWVDGLAHALQEGLARVCGQNIAALQGTRFAHFARHDTMGEPMALSSHPVLKHHVEHLDFMLHETRKDLELTRVHAHRAQMALAHHADAIRLLAKDRRSLRLQRAKKDATIARLREKIRTLEVTVRTQQDQIQEMEEDGEDIQGGEDFLSHDNDFEEDEFTEEEDYEFLEAAEDGIIPIDVDEDDEE